MNRSDIFNLSALVGVVSVGAILAHELIRQPIREDGITVYADGTASVSLGTTTYDFKNVTVQHVGGVINSPQVEKIQVSEKSAYDEVHRKACKIAQGHKEYEQVCIGLKFNPS